MKRFSALERKIISEIIKLDEREGFIVLGNIFDPESGLREIPDHAYIAVNAPDDVTIQIQSSELDMSSLRDLDRKLSRLLVTVVELFRDLESNRLAYFFGENESSTIGNEWSVKSYETLNTLNKEIKEDLYKYSSKEIFITEELRFLANNDFKTEEEIRHEEELRVAKCELLFTRVALLISILGLFASIIIPFIQNEVLIKNKTIHLDVSTPDLTNAANVAQDTLIDISQGVERLASDVHALGRESLNVKPSTSPGEGTVDPK